MPVNDFLFEGRPPPSVTTYGQTIDSMPKWLSDYTQGLVARANAIAAEPYQPYGGPRIADFSPDEMAGFGMTRANIGAYQPYMDAAGATLTGGLDMTADHLASGTRDFTSSVGDYMDPFIGHVLSRQQELSNRNLQENLIPQLQNTFTRAGHFGSDRMMDLAGRTFRDVGENLQREQLGALSQAYNQAGQLFGADRARDLQAAGISAETGIQGARELGALGRMASQMGFGDAAALEAIGRTNRGLTQDSLNLAYQDFLQQRNYPRETIDWMSSVIRGLPYDQARQTTNYGPIAGLDYGASGASQLAGLISTGLGAYETYQNLGRAEGGLAQYARGGFAEKPAEPHYWKPTEGWGGI